MQKIVFNGHYFDYIDVAVAEYWRAQNPTRSQNPLFTAELVYVNADPVITNPAPLLPRCAN